MKILEKRNSKINGRIIVAKSLGLGTYIQVEGLTQSGGIVESIWKSTLKKINHKPLTINHCLILGLGGGTAAKVVKKLWPEAKITGVEIDPVMVDLGIRYLSLETSGVKVVVGDAEGAIKRIKIKYDLVLVDIYLGDKSPDKFEKPGFLRILSERLSRGGVIVFNRLYYGNKRSEAVKFGEKLTKVFSKVEYFYPEANMMFVCKT